MGLRARLTLMVVVGLVLIVSGAVYTEMLPWQTQGQTVGAMRPASGPMPSESVSCSRPGDGCGSKDSASNCSIGGCATAKLAAQNQVSQQEDKQPEKVAAGEQSATQTAEKSKTQAAK
jgi:hypothetical protein